MNQNQSSQKISFIISVYYEEQTISRLLNTLLIHGSEKNIEIIVVDGGSEDQTIEKAI